MAKQKNKTRGGVYKRADSAVLWISYYDASGRRQPVSSGTTDQALAEKKWQALDKKARLEERQNAGDEGPVTVAKYSEGWLKKRVAAGIMTADKDEQRLQHVPQLMKMRLDAVKRLDVKNAIADLMHAPQEKRLAPRTIRHVYACLRVMFNDALAEELIVATPCTLKQRMREIPKKTDRDPKWRRAARFTRQEVEQLISDPRLLEHRRMLYGLMLLAGPRINEITPRRWRDYDPEAQPLGSLSIHSSWNLRKRVEKDTKTGEPREVPVHPTLAKMLATWKAGGWERYQGRLPRPDDLIMPAVQGGVLNSNTSWWWLQNDLATLGLRPRGQHDTRRTFISLAIGDGAHKHLLRWVTHGPEGDQMDEYTTPPWDGLCREVSVLRVRLFDGDAKVLPLPTATALLHHSQQAE